MKAKYEVVVVKMDRALDRSFVIVKPATRVALRSPIGDLEFRGLVSDGTLFTGDVLWLVTEDELAPPAKEKNIRKKAKPSS